MQLRDYEEMTANGNNQAESSSNGSSLNGTAAILQRTMESLYEAPPEEEDNTEGEGKTYLSFFIIRKILNVSDAWKTRKVLFFAKNKKTIKNLLCRSVRFQRLPTINFLLFYFALSSIFWWIYCIIICYLVIRNLRQSLLKNLQKKYFGHCLEIRKLDSQLDHLSEYMDKVEERLKAHNEKLMETLKQQKEEREKRRRSFHEVGNFNNMI